MINQVQLQDSPQTASTQILPNGCTEAVLLSGEPPTGRNIFAKRTQFRSTLHVKFQKCPSQTNPVWKPHGPDALGCIWVRGSRLFTYHTSRITHPVSLFTPHHDSIFPPGSKPFVIQVLR